MDRIENTIVISENTGKEAMFGAPNPRNAMVQIFATIKIEYKWCKKTGK
jgi:hypothetical protein